MLRLSTLQAAMHTRISVLVIHGGSNASLNHCRKKIKDKRKGRLLHCFTAQAALNSPAMRHMGPSAKQPSPTAIWTDRAPSHRRR